VRALAVYGLTLERMASGALVGRIGYPLTISGRPALHAPHRGQVARRHMAAERHGHGLSGTQLTR